MKKISILGSTGSIGTQTLDVVRRNGGIRVEALSAGRNIRLLERQVREFRPMIAAVWDERDAQDFRDRIADLDTTVCAGMDGLIQVATVPSAQMVVTAIVGMIGIRPAIEAIREGKDIALANKETLVCAGHIIMPLAAERGVKILPVDSEHSAIFQSLNGEDRRDIEKILLTCSGGPFLGYTNQQLSKVTVEDALKNPNWHMGRKITVDSATLVNKGLEVMEAGWLFGISGDQIEVIIQPQSVVHSAVQFIDGAVIAQLGVPDMRLPIQYALFWPERRTMDTERLNFFALKDITFQEPDIVTFKGLPLARRAMREGGTMPTVFNASNEIASALFLDQKIGFLDIYRIIEECMDKHKVIQAPSIETILDTEREVYKHVASLLPHHSLINF